MFPLFFIFIYTIICFFWTHNYIIKTFQSNTISICIQFFIIRHCIIVANYLFHLCYLMRKQQLHTTIVIVVTILSSLNFWHHCTAATIFNCITFCAEKHKRKQTTNKVNTWKTQTRIQQVTRLHHRSKQFHNNQKTNKKNAIEYPLLGLSIQNVFWGCWNLPFIHLSLIVHCLILLHAWLLPISVHILLFCFVLDYIFCFDAEKNQNCINTPISFKLFFFPCHLLDPLFHVKKKKIKRKQNEKHKQ